MSQAHNSRPEIGKQLGFSKVSFGHYEVSILATGENIGSVRSSPLRGGNRYWKFKGIRDMEDWSMPIYSSRMSAAVNLHLYYSRCTES